MRISVTSKYDFCSTILDRATCKLLDPSSRHEELPHLKDLLLSIPPNQVKYSFIFGQFFSRSNIVLRQYGVLRITLERDLFGRDLAHNVQFISLDTN